MQLLGQVLRRVDTCISFVSAVGGGGSKGGGGRLGEGVGELGLANYLRSDLLMSESEVAAFGTTISQTVTLKQLEALHGLLEVLAEVDPLARCPNMIPI
eukprot:SAG31_NODE_5517_length_2482_cov_3.611414_4_plen_99_part_00